MISCVLRTADETAVALPIAVRIAGSASMARCSVARFAASTMASNSTKRSLHPGALAGHIVSQLVVRSTRLRRSDRTSDWYGRPARPDEALFPDQFELGLDRPGYRVTPYFVVAMGCTTTAARRTCRHFAHHFCIPHDRWGIDGAGEVQIRATKVGCAYDSELVRHRRRRMARTFQLPRGTAPVHRTDHGCHLHTDVITNISTTKMNRTQSTFDQSEGVTP